MWALLADDVGAVVVVVVPLEPELVEPEDVEPPAVDPVPVDPVLVEPVLVDPVLVEPVLVEPLEVVVSDVDGVVEPCPEAWAAVTARTPVAASPLAATAAVRPRRRRKPR